MKVLVVLALAVAVAQAGFTGSLNQQVRPHLQQAIQQIRADLAVKVPARNSAEVAFQAKFLDALTEQITSHLTNLETAFNQAQAIVQAATTAAHTAAEQMQQLGALTATQVQDIMSGFVASIMGLLNNQGRALPPFVIPIIHAVASSPEFLSAVHTSATYICLKGENVDITFQDVIDINNNKPDGWNDFLALEAVQKCIAQAGGLTHMIQSSSIVQNIQEMVAPLGLSSMIPALVSGAVGEPWASQIIAGLASRGLFSNIGNAVSGAWNHVSGGIVDAASGAWDHVSGAASGFADYVSQLASQALVSASVKLEIIKRIAAEFLAQGVSGLAQMAADKAFELMVVMAPHAAALGSTWNQALGLYESVHGLFNPTPNN